MHKKVKSTIARMLLISMLFTQNRMMPAAYIMADSIAMGTQNANKATSSDMDGADSIASDSDLDGEVLENDLEPLPDEDILESIEAATISNAYTLNRYIGAWDGSSEEEITPIGNTYYVTNPAELAWVSKVTNDGQESFEGKIVSVLDDLDLGGHEWPGIGTSKNPFCGSFEGNNHSISGLVNEDSDCVGLFGSITANDNIYLRNLILDAAECSGNAKSAGLLVGQIHVNSKEKVMISNMDISGGLDIVRGNESSIAVKWYIGGVVGKVTSGDGAVLEVNKVRVNGNIRVTCVGRWHSSLCGGLVGYSELSGVMEITDSSFSGNIVTEVGEGTAVGGLIGQTNSSTLRLKLVYVEGSVKGTGGDATNVGGFMGDAACPTLSIQDSYVAADVISGSSGNSAPGGLIGCLNCQLDYAESLIKNCHISGGVSGRNFAVYIANNGSETETVSVEDCYYDKSKPGLYTDHIITSLKVFNTITLDCPGIHGLTNAEAREEYSYVDWDFMNVWTLEDGDYPKLRENVVLNKGLLAGMDSEVLIYYLPEERYETEFFDLNYEYCIDEEEILEGDVQTEDVLAQIKIRLPQGFSFSPDESVTESYVSDGRAPEGYVYVNLGEQGRGSIRVYVTEALEKAESFQFRISINATGFEVFSSYSDMSVAMKNEQPGYVPEDAVYNPGNGHYYKVFDHSMSWDEAKEYCEALKGHLVTITSQQEQYFVNRLLEKSIKQNMWIGAEMLLEEWHWIQSEKWEYTNWNEGEPDYLDGDLVAAMMYTYSGMNGDGEKVELGSWKSELKEGVDSEKYANSNVGFVCEWEETVDYTVSFKPFKGEKFVKRRANEANKLTLMFDQIVKPGKGYIRLKDYETDKVLEEIFIDENSYQISPVLDKNDGKCIGVSIIYGLEKILPYGAKVYVEIDKGTILLGDDYKEIFQIDNKEDWYFYIYPYDVLRIPNDEEKKIPSKLYHMLWGPLTAKILAVCVNNMALCSGMCEATYAWKNSEYFIKTYDGNQYLGNFKLRNTSKFTDLTFEEYIELSQIFQMTSNVSKTKKNNVNKLQKLYNNLNNDIVIRISGIQNKEKSSHAIIPLEIMDTDEICRVLVYDPNHFEEVHYLELKKENGVIVDWFYPIMEWGKDRDGFSSISFTPAEWEQIGKVILENSDDIKKNIDDSVLLSTGYRRMTGLNNAIPITIETEAFNSSYVDAQLYWIGEDSVQLVGENDSDAPVTTFLCDGYRKITIDTTENAEIKIDLEKGDAEISFDREMEYSIEFEKYIEDENSEIVRVYGNAQKIEAKYLDNKLSVSGGDEYNIYLEKDGMNDNLIVGDASSNVDTIIKVMDNKLVLEKNTDEENVGEPNNPVNPEYPEKPGSSDHSKEENNDDSIQSGNSSIYISDIPYIYVGTWEQSGEKWRFILDNGSYAGMSWIYYKSKWYAIGQDGYMLVGWNLLGGEWYYFNPDGSMAVGWIIYDNQKYYLNPISDGSQGKMLTGWQMVDGKWYYFNEIPDGTRGMLLTDTWIGEYYVDQKGVWEKEAHR